MGIRARTYILIAPSVRANYAAPWLAAQSAEITHDARGTLITFDVNLRPTWARFQDAPGPVTLVDLTVEMDMLAWLGTIGAASFRLVRIGEIQDYAGTWPATAYRDDPEVEEIELEAFDFLGPEGTLLPEDKHPALKPF